MPHRILNQLQEWFRPTPGKTLYYPELTGSSPGDYEAVFNCRYRYLLIKNFISPPELQYMTAQIQQLLENPDLLLEFRNDRSYIGIPILEAEDPENYFRVAEYCNREQERMIGFSFNKRLLEVLQRISSVPVSMMPPSQSGKAYLGNVIRLLTLNYFHHCDKQTLDEHPMATEINTRISPFNTVSAYAVIRKPRKGGRLVLFDKLYRDTPAEILEANALRQFDRVHAYIEKYRKTYIQVDEGDLVLFGGGQIWHMIEPIKSELPRITMGCITGYSREKDSLYFWT